MPHSGPDAVSGMDRLQPYEAHGPRMVRAIRAARAARRLPLPSTVDHAPTGAGNLGTAPIDDAMLDAVFSAFQPPDARGIWSGYLGWPELGKLALAVGGVALSREAYEDACTLGGVRPGRGFTRGDLGRFYQLPPVQGFQGTLRPCSSPTSAWRPAAARRGHEAAAYLRYRRGCELKPTSR
jgi:hypothetical protein